MKQPFCYLSMNPSKFLRAMFAASFYLCLTALFSACDGSSDASKAYSEEADEYGFSAATRYTIELNKDVGESLPLDDPQDFEDAKRGLIAQHPNLKVSGPYKLDAWDQTAYEFVKGDAPDTVNPSLWRQAKLNNIHGLFKVTDGIYQLRGFDLANMTIIEGENGWIVVDPLTSIETSKVAMDFAREQLGDHPISAILFTHSHVDHFGGVLGIISAEEAKNNKVRIIAPEGFMKEVTRENVIAGLAMGRRAMLMYGFNLPRSERGHVDTGLGKSPSNGSISILEPTETIDHTQQTLNIDGVEFVFQHTPESEAPAEFTFYLPAYKAFCGAEVVSRNMHNVYTLRGAKVRDALQWSNYIDEAKQLFSDADIYFASHHWPMWGNENIQSFLEKQRDTYKFIHDQSVRLINSGYTPNEIAEELELPSTLSGTFSNRGYYGTLRHNAKAVYQGYMGWYDSNLANLNPLPPEEAGARYVDVMGGADNVMMQAKKYFDKGEYRWVAELLNHLVFADSGHTGAKELLARTYDQLGYQSESGPWRDEYLSAAYELRHGFENDGLNPARMEDVLRQTPISYFFDAMAVNIDGVKADGVEGRVKFVFTDTNETYLLEVKNAVLHHHKVSDETASDATLYLTHELFLNMLIDQSKVLGSIMTDDFKIEGSKIFLVRFLSLLARPDGSFNVVTP